MASSTSSSSSLGSSKASSPSRTSMWHVEQLALRHEKGIGASWSSIMSAMEPPRASFAVTDFWPSADSNVTLGMGMFYHLLSPRAAGRVEKDGVLGARLVPEGVLCARVEMRSRLRGARDGRKESEIGR